MFGGTRGAAAIGHVTGASTPDAAMTDWLGGESAAFLSLLETHQYGLLALVIGLEAAGVPWPVATEFAMVVMGYQVFRAEANPAVVVTIVVASGTLGAIVLYWAGRLLGRPLLGRYGRWLRMRPERIARLEDWFGRRGAKVVVIGRLIPGVRILVPVVAGVARARFPVFLASAVAGNTLWGALYVGLGWGFGDQFEATLAALTGNPTPVVAAVGGAASLIAACWIVRFRRPLARVIVAALPGVLAR